MGLPQLQQNLPVLEVPQLHTQLAAAGAGAGLGLPQFAQNLPVLPVWPQLQTLTDLEQALRSPGGGVRLRDEAARIYEFPDGTVYHFTVRPVQDKYGIPYTEVMATDVTQLARLHAALQQENERLADANRRAKRLYDNMPDIVREEEILKMKMRVHDDIGHTLLAARRALRHEHDLARLRSEAAKWESSISLLCRARQENAAEDPLSYMQRRAAVLGAAVQLRGAYPATPSAPCASSRTMPCSPMSAAKWSRSSWGLPPSSAKTWNMSLTLC